MMKNKRDIGLIGLAVMGENLALNLANHGYAVSVYNRTLAKTKSFIEGRGANKAFFGASSLEELVNSIERPRKIILMIKAGEAVDLILQDICPLLEAADIIIDGGNSFFLDTKRREATLRSQGLYFIGCGISGGEEGALNGPSLMPGGAPEAWPTIAPIFKSIAAKVADGTPCCEWIGAGGAGHFVKMVHNGIEYGDIQLICECYHFMRDYLKMSYDDMQRLFAKWNQGRLDSYLIESTSRVLAFKDGDGTPLVEKILDRAGQKGTGKWTVNTALELGQPVSLIAQSVFARTMSALKDRREEIASRFVGFDLEVPDNQAETIEQLEAALYLAKIVSYTEGFALLGDASDAYKWDLDLGRIAFIWREGCIIRSVFLEKINIAYRQNGNLSNLMLADFFANEIDAGLPALRRIVAAGALAGIPMPSLGAALAYFDTMRNNQLPANLLQALRDYFGAHTYERIDRPRGEFFHTHWT